MSKTRKSKRLQCFHYWSFKFWIYTNHEVVCGLTNSLECNAFMHCNATHKGVALQRRYHVKNTKTTSA